jgi:hypothetical protein
MHADTVVALVAAGLAAIIAVVVPWMTFRLALRQDQARWLREQRAQLYVDLLTEAHAEEEYLGYVMALPETAETMRSYYVDVRLPPLERARLGARGAIFGSRATNRLFNKLRDEDLSASLQPHLDDGDQRIIRMRAGRIVDELQATIRRELGADRILLEPARPAADRDTPKPSPPPDR